MPVENLNASANKAPKPVSKSASPEKGVHCCGRNFGGDFAHKILLTLVGVLLVYGIVFLASLIRNNLQKFYFIGKADKMERVITIDGEGKVTVSPDVAVVTMGVIVKDPQVAEAQKKSTVTMQDLIDKLGKLGVDKADIQTTNYNIYPKYKYNNQGELPDGYEVNQSVTIKIRDTAKVNDVLALAGQVGANNVSNVQFIVDDPEMYKAEARKIALEKIVAKAKQLSEDLGVKIVGVVSYNEFQNNKGDVYGMGGYGGGGPVQTGNNEIVLQANVTFEIR